MGKWELEVDGVFKDFDIDYGFKVKSFPGTGHSPVINRSTNYAIQDGALFTGQKMGIRVFTLIGTFYGSETLEEFHDQREALIKALSSRTVKINEKPKPVTIKYTGATEDKEIECVYEGGLELATFTPYIENDVPVRFSAFNPQWNATSDTVGALDTEDTLSSGYMFQRVDSIWARIASPVPNAAVNDIQIATNGDVYAGGGFNAGGGGPGDRIAKWDGSAWSALGSGLNAPCNAIAIAPNGDVYVCGDFTTAGGGGANYVAKWDGLSWSALGTGLNASGEAIAYDINTGDVYVAGTFTTAGGGGANRIAKWDGSTWTALGTGLNGSAFSVNILGSNVYAGGDFTTAGGVTVNRIAEWDGATWANILPGAGFNGTVSSIEFDSNSNLYAAGSFTTLNAVAFGYVAKYDFTTWTDMNGGLDANVNDLYVDANDNVFACGEFDTSDPLEIGHLAEYDGNSWGGVGIDVAAETNAVNGDGADLYIGTETNATPAADGYTTISYPGSEVAYPVFEIGRTGGTALNPLALSNSLTGATIVFDYELLDGETLTIDFRPGNRSAISSVFGERWDSINDDSDISSFFLQPGNNTGSTDNIIILSIFESGSPTITANLTYRTAYRSLD